MRPTSVKPKETGENINRMRKESGLTIKDIQKAMGFETPQAVYKWVHGESLPSLDNLVILAALLDATIDDIIITEHRDVV